MYPNLTAGSNMDGCKKTINDETSLTEGLSVALSEVAQHKQREIELPTLGKFLDEVRASIVTN